MVIKLTRYRAFHNKAKALKPDQPSKPTTYWVGVLNDGKKPEDVQAENDFLWLKCHKVNSICISNPFESSLTT